MAAAGPGQVPVEPGREIAMAPGQAQAVVSAAYPVQVSVRAMEPETMGSDPKTEPVSARDPASAALWVLALVTAPVIKVQAHRMAQASEPERKIKRISHAGALQPRLFISKEISCRALRIPGFYLQPSVHCLHGNCPFFSENF